MPLDHFISKGHPPQFHKILWVCHFCLLVVVYLCVYLVSQCTHVSINHHSISVTAETETQTDRMEHKCMSQHAVSVPYKMGNEQQIFFFFLGVCVNLTDYFWRLWDCFSNPVLLWKCICLDRHGKHLVDLGNQLPLWQKLACCPCSKTFKSLDKVDFMNKSENSGRNCSWSTRNHTSRSLT